MEQRFRGRVVLVTGAASGIGLAAAERFAAEGARIAVADISGDGLEILAAAVDKAGGEVLTQICDVTDRESIRETVEATVKHFGGLQVLCNVAGRGSFEHTEEVTPEQWERIIGVNLSGTFFMSQAALPHLLANESGAIVNVASLAGLIGQAYTAAYCASKAGVVSLTKCMAVEFAKRGLRVNCVCPGPVRTPILGNFLPPRDADLKLIERLALTGRIAEPAEVAAAMVYLASDEAASINGVALPMDSGTSAG
ncbi:MAG: SDR family oxidoreductase [Deltaproteobacteria bacterium]|nr:SDR family oxidoreductase [Deltaproteobacteria bacterium]MBW2419628.1 SDR family oxidoreductase [Deltaproteobacteria bacterium]